MSDAVDWHSEIASSFDSKYQSSADFRERYDIWNALIQRYCKADGRVLDFGCGSGVLTFSAAACNREVIGIDGSPAMLELCQKKQEALGTDNVDFISGRLESLDLNALGSFDLILCSSVLEYLDDFWKALSVLQGLLKSEGVLIFSVPNRESLYRKLEHSIYSLTGRPRYYSYVRHWFTKKDLSSAVENKAWKVLETDYYGVTPVLSRLFRQMGMAAHSDNLLLLVCRKL